MAFLLPLPPCSLAAGGGGGGGGTEEFQKGWLGLVQYNRYPVPWERAERGRVLWELVGYCAVHPLPSAVGGVGGRGFAKAGGQYIERPVLCFLHDSALPIRRFG